MKSAKSVEETHFVSFAAIVSTWDLTDGSSFHIWDTMITKGKISGDRFSVIEIVDRPTMFTKTHP